MISNEELKKKAEEVVEQLSAVREEFIKDKKELEISIRKDVVKTELKSILSESSDYDTLKKSLEVYIENLI